MCGMCGGVRVMCGMREGEGDVWYEGGTTSRANTEAPGWPLTK